MRIKEYLCLSMGKGRKTYFRKYLTSSEMVPLVVKWWGTLRELMQSSVVYVAFIHQPINQLYTTVCELFCFFYIQ